MSTIEILGAATALLGVMANVKRLLVGWVFSMVACVFYAYFFYENTFYAEALLQVYFFFQSGYGLYHWLYGGKDTNALPIGRLDKKGWAISLGFTLGLTGLLFYLLNTFTDSQMPWADALITGGSIVAQILLARKLIENWHFWFVIDVFAVGVYLDRGWWITAGLYAVFIILILIALRDWKKAWKQQKV